MHQREQRNLHRPQGQRLRFLPPTLLFRKDSGVEISLAEQDPTHGFTTGQSEQDLRRGPLSKVSGCDSQQGPRSATQASSGGFLGARNLYLKVFLG